MTLLERKHQRSFNHLDHDRNGYIDHSDLVALGKRVLSGFGISPDSPRGKTLVTSFESLWGALLAHCDVDSDGRIDRDEFHRGMSGAFVEDTGGWERAFQPAAMSVISIVDTDDDGVLNLDEFSTFQRAFGSDPEQIEYAFRALDRDGSGTLSVEELASAARQFYTGTDESAPGNALFGRV